MIMPINLRIRMIFGYVETGVRGHRLAARRDYEALPPGPVHHSDHFIRTNHRCRPNYGPRFWAGRSPGSYLWSCLAGRKRGKRGSLRARVGVHGVGYG